MLKLLYKNKNKKLLEPINQAGNSKLLSGGEGEISLSSKDNINGMFLGDPIHATQDYNKVKSSPPKTVKK